VTRSCAQDGCACDGGVAARVERLYVVVDGTLAPGLQIAQAIHAARAFAAEHPEIEAAWFERSNTVAVLAVDGERSVIRVANEAAALDVPHSTFDEPDLLGRMTAIALAPGYLSERIVRGLKPALG